MSVDWGLKIKAFLYWAPWGALSDQPQRGEELIQIVLGSVDLTVAAQAQAMASALDAPCLLPKDRWNVWKNNPILIHPLVGEASPKISLPNEALEDFRNTVMDAIQRLKSLCSAENQKDISKKLFLALWRLLPDPLWEPLKRCSPELRAIWELFPADPRMPYHSIWDLASTASALAATYDRNNEKFEPALLVFTIASAQEFVAAARRTQDLWMGSFLLSYLIWRAMEPIAEECGPDAILSPDLRSQPLVDRWLLYTISLNDPVIEARAKDYDRLRIANLPNIFTALVPKSDAKKLAGEAVEALEKAKTGIAEAVREYVENTLQQDQHLSEVIQKATEGIRDPVYQTGLSQHLNDNLQKLKTNHTWRKIWQRQIRDFLKPQVFWVTLPCTALGETLEEIKTKFKQLAEFPKDLEEFYNKLTEEGCISANNAVMVAYPLLSSLTGRLLAVRKNLRHFDGIEEPGHKCTQCGVREALHPPILWEEVIKNMLQKDQERIPDLDPYPEARIFWQILQRVGEEGDTAYKLAGRIRRGDRLCAVCLTKRLAWEAFFLKKSVEKGGFSDVKEELERKERLPAHLLFPSTASIATAKFKELVLEHLRSYPQDGLWNKLKEYLKNMRKLDKRILYPSAEIPKLEKLANDVSQKLGSEAKQDLNDFLRLDGDWLFPESFDPQAVQREYGVESEQLRSALANVKKALQELLDTAEEKGIPAPRRYLAILAMDGDRMGDWLTGQLGSNLYQLLHPDLRQDQRITAEVLKDIRPMGPVHQRVLSHALRTFALEIVRPVVEESFCGRLIYAGGDDVLALLPLEELPGVIRHLQQLFVGTPKEGIKIGLGDSKHQLELDVFPTLVEKRDKEEERRRILLPGWRTPHDGRGPTISAGVAIVHYTHPLWHAVEEARETLKKAKKAPNEGGWGRDAWAATILKRSGEPRISGGKWYYKELNVWEGIAEVLESFKKGLSPRLIHQMQELKAGMETLRPEAQEEILRELLKRREKLREEDVRKLQENIPSWFKKINSGFGGGWCQVLEWLCLARFLAKEERG